MLWMPQVMLFPLLCFAIESSIGNFDVFMEQPFAINWRGPLSMKNQGELDASSTGGMLLMTTRDKEEYRCIVPDIEDDDAAHRPDDLRQYDGPPPDELIDRLHTTSLCTYRLEGYWTYELCHGKHLRQYHSTKVGAQKALIHEFFLGFSEGFLTRHRPNVAIPRSSPTGTVSESAVPEHISDDEMYRTDGDRYRSVDGVELRYHQVTITGGTPCDLTLRPRSTRLLYVCQSEGHGEILEVKETSTCEYEAVVLTSALCSHPLFRPNKPYVNDIQCHAMSGSPSKPNILDRWEREAKWSKELNKGAVTSRAGRRGKPSESGLPTSMTGLSASAGHVDTEIGRQTDKQMLREFLSGEQCLRGGTGWWLYELCIGRHARQYHKETSIMLGYFSKENHLQWLADNTHKKPKPASQRRQLSFLYSDGDVCGITGKARSVEVRLKCVTKSSTQHSVSIFLSEPTFCEYVLVVESGMFCELMSKADEHGLLDNVKL